LKQNGGHGTCVKKQYGGQETRVLKTRWPTQPTLEAKMADMEHTVEFLRHHCEHVIVVNCHYFRI